MILHAQNSSPTTLKNSTSHLNQPQTYGSTLMNSIFKPDHMDSVKNRSLMLEDISWTNMEIQFAHFVIINLLIVLPPFLHVLGECRIYRADVCSKFIIAVISGCFFSFIMGTKALTLTFLSRTEEDMVDICTSYITVDNIVLVWLVFVTAQYNVSAVRTSVWVQTAVRLLLWVWFAVAMVMQLMTYIMARDLAWCVSSTIHVGDATRIYMPMVNIGQTSSAFTVSSAVLFIPPAVMILTSGHRLRQQKGFIADQKSTSLGGITYNERTCMVCARTLTLFDLRCWRSLLCLLLGVIKPCWMLGNWYSSSQHRDFPPVIVICLVFYPMCVAQTINYFMCLYSHPRSNVYHI